MITIDFIRIDTPKGISISEQYHNALEFAVKHRCKVEFEFNEQIYFVDYAQIVKAFSCDVGIGDSPQRPVGI